MDITLFQFGLIIVGGFLAGVMNTLAGYGSMISLSLLMDVIGLPPNVANGTNRVNVIGLEVPHPHIHLIPIESMS
ncbi:hypothetical protein N9Q80_02235 [Saprospiraceae bacterium]|nr:hypothetical protein [Saprospiraceae bacterium]